MSYRFLAVVSLVLALAAVAGAQEDAKVGGSGSAKEERPALTVSGTGETRVAPDLATVRLGVTRQDDTARGAQAKVSDVAQKILEGVKAVGIDPKQIQTSQLSLSPIYAQPKPGEEAQPPRVIAYIASNFVTVRVEKLSLVGDVIDAALKAGANQLDSLQFGLRNDRAARREALTAAATEAAEKAKVLAAALGVTLVRVLSVQEAGGYSPQPFMERSMMARGDAGTPVSPGEVQVSASVTVRYEIRGK